MITLSVLGIYFWMTILFITGILGPLLDYSRKKYNSEIDASELKLIKNSAAFCFFVAIISVCGLLSSTLILCLSLLIF